MKKIINYIVSLVFPARCVSCGVMTSAESAVCVECWKGLHFISGPSCAKCDYPFEFDIDEGMLCGSCLKEDWYFDRVLSVLRYSDTSKTIVSKLKYSDKTHIAKQCGLLMRKKIAHKLADYDYIIPVPMHRSRLRKRFYNQSSLIASHLSSFSGIEVLHNGLVKMKSHAPQTGLTRAGRKINVRGSFSINDSYRDRIKGSSVLLVDDVYTTGATVNECSRVLKRAKAESVTVVTLARVV